MKEAFTDWRPQTAATIKLLDLASQVVIDYQRQGYQLTLRQLYYQLVARDYIPNAQREYKKLGDLLTKARLAGIIDWEAIVDRGRSPVVPAEWASPASIMNAAANGYRLDRWEGQAHYVEVWCEKDALASVIEPACDRLHVRFMANRGYSSITAMYDGAQRMRDAVQRDQSPVVIYLGDHDPSGLDMTRDIRDRLELLTNGQPVEVRRIALNFDQVQSYNPPPNPVKWTDSRADAYQLEYGQESWELDALEPRVLDALVDETINEYLGRDLYDERLELEELHRAAIREAGKTISDRF